MTTRREHEVKAGPARAMNPEAGGHAVVADPHLLRASEAAAVRSLARYPYLALRFGRRGEVFTRSDSAWLVLVAHADEARAMEQVAWLGALLAARGMPRRLLEFHLVALAEELEAAVPGGAGASRLARAAGVLAAERAEVGLGDAALAELAAAFDAAVGEERARLPEAGALVGAAVADEACGLSGAVEALAGWLADPARFSGAWAAAVRRAVEAARAIAA